MVAATFLRRIPPCTRTTSTTIHGGSRISQLSQSLYLSNAAFRRRIGTAASSSTVSGATFPLPASQSSHNIPAHTTTDDLHATKPSRLETVRTAKPFSDFLTDTFKRQHNYLRISITERCNLRCLYCMPEEGIELSPTSKLLTTPEILHIARLFVSQGVTKIRLTGGEPSIRKDIVHLVSELGKLKEQGLKELAMTSNGLVLARKLPALVEGGLTGVNISLDTLLPWKFEVMTRRKGLEAVLRSIDKALELGVNPVKINFVVMKGVNADEVLDFVEMTREKPVEVRFIEYMPFDGNKWNEAKMMPYAEMLEHIRTKYPGLTRATTDAHNDTSKTWTIPGHAGRLGFITSMTHNFCGSCNRLRVTSDGNLKVCLFGEEEVSLRDLMRGERREEAVESAASGSSIASQEALVEVRNKMDKKMLEVIGLAVKGKKEKHAGIGELENMKNRPMILIGG